jgi:uncharacterized protein (TIGR03435 family)
MNCTAPSPDVTGPTGRYDFAVSFQRTRGPRPPEATLPDIFEALQSVGLKLEPKKGPLDVIVIDHIEKTPTEN